jgi:uncharacterized Tic20 family protein
MNSTHLQSAFQTGATFVSEKRYHIEFDGKIIPGWEFEEVKANLAKLLKANEEKLHQLFSGRRFIIKKNVDYQTAIKINNVLKDAGADCIISPAPNSDTAVPPPLPSQSKPSQTDQRPSAAAKPLPVPTQIRPGRFWYVVAILLFLVPIIAGGKSIFNAFTSYFSGGTRLMVPGETTIQAEEPGTYFIFYETSVFTESNVAQNLLGRDFDIRILDLATGAELKLSPPEFAGTETYDAIVRQAIAEVEFDTSGNYYAEVAGELSGNDGLLIRHVDFAGMIKGIVSAVVLLFLGFVAGPVVALVVLIKRQNNKRKLINKPMSENEERQWAMFAHIGTFSSMIVPLGNIIAPIVVWQLKKNESRFVVEQAKESLNFQITLMIYAVISFLLVFIIIGFFLIFALVIFSLIIVIVAGVKANDGQHYRYPMTLRLIS